MAQSPVSVDLNQLLRQFPKYQVRVIVQEHIMYPDNGRADIWSYSVHQEVGFLTGRGLCSTVVACTGELRNEKPFVIVWTSVLFADIAPTSTLIQTKVIELRRKDLGVVRLNFAVLC